MFEIVQPGTVILPIADGMIQVGSSPGHSFVLTNLKTEDERWLRALIKRAKLTPADRRRYASRRGTRTPLVQRREIILDLLREHRLLIGVPERSALADLHVRVVGLDRVGVPLARTLAAVGVRHLDLRDSRPVTREVEYLFQSDFLGLSRADALRNEIRNGHIYLSRQSDPDLVISMENHVIEHGRAGLLLSKDTIHLPIVLDDRSIQVGPVSVPSVTCCYLCMDYHQMDQLSAWPALREELRLHAAPQPSPALANTAASLAALLIEALASAAVPAEAPADPDWYVGLSWRVHETGVEETRWQPHPRCQCQATDLNKPLQDGPRSRTFRRKVPGQGATPVAAAPNSRE